MPLFRAPDLPIQRQSHPVGPQGPLLDPLPQGEKSIEKIHLTQLLTRESLPLARSGHIAPSRGEEAEQYDLSEVENIDTCEYWYSAMLDVHPEHLLSSGVRTVLLSPGHRMSWPNHSSPTLWSPTGTSYWPNPTGSQRARDPMIAAHKVQLQGKSQGLPGKVNVRCPAHLLKFDFLCWQNQRTGKGKRKKKIKSFTPILRIFQKGQTYWVQVAFCIFCSLGSLNHCADGDCADEECIHPRMSIYKGELGFLINCSWAPAHQFFPFINCLLQSCKIFTLICVYITFQLGKHRIFPLSNFLWSMPSIKS